MAKQNFSHYLKREKPKKLFRHKKRLNKQEKRQQGR